jgi:hypothetical protein
VTGFSSLGGNTYQWTLASALGNNKYVFAIATTGSSFGTPGSTQVTDANGAGISGTFTTNSSTFPSGNGLAGSTFDFFFDVLPGNAGWGTGVTTQTSTSDTTLARTNNNQHETSGTYKWYIDYNGAGQTTTADVTFNQTHNNVHNSTLTSPTAPAAGLAGGSSGGSGFTALALGVQETGSSSSGSSASVANVNSTSTTPVTTTSVTTSSTGSAGSGSTTTSTTSSRGHGSHSFAATDAAVSEFDLADLWA